jgi:hypothetical protein
MTEPTQKWLSNPAGPFKIQDRIVCVATLDGQIVCKWIGEGKLAEDAYKVYDWDGFETGVRVDDDTDINASVVGDEISVFFRLLGEVNRVVINPMTQHVGEIDALYNLPKGKPIQDFSFIIGPSSEAVHVQWKAEGLDEINPAWYWTDFHF